MNFSGIEYELSAGTKAQLPPSSLPELVFSGRSNVGKSSLINKLFNRKKLARVSSKPGKTVTVNFYRTDTARIVDLPGYGYAEASGAERRRWSRVADFYFRSGRDIRLVVQLVDMRVGPTEDDLNMLEFLSAFGFPFIVVLTKADKLKSSEFQSRLSELELILSPFEALDIIPSSALSGRGIDSIKDCLERAAEA